jgi:uncharacterized protein (DUF983 family)
MICLHRFLKMIKTCENCGSKLIEGKEYLKDLCEICS